MLVTELKPATIISLKIKSGHNLYLPKKTKCGLEFPLEEATGLNPGWVRKVDIPPSFSKSGSRVNAVHQTGKQGKHRPVGYKSKETSPWRT